MFFQLFILVVLMMVLTYSLKPVSRQSSGQPKGGFASFGNARRDPFSRQQQTSSRGSHHTIDKGAMTRCHNCATFFPVEQVVHEMVQGHILEFCSASCRDSFVHGT